MTEILGSGDGHAERYARPDPLVPASLVDSVGDIVDLDDDLDDGSDDYDALGGRPAPWWRDVLGVLAEPGTLAVAAVLAALAAVMSGPSYRYDAYPFNEGVSSVSTVFTQLSAVRPLHQYLTNVAPTAVLVLVAAIAGLLALARSRGREHEPRWVRPLAGGALLVALVLAALVAVGAYRTSTYDLRVPQSTSSFTSG